MDRFTDLVASLKAWQAFVLLVLPVIALQFYLMSSITSSSQSPSMEEPETLLRQIMLMSLLMVVPLLTWLLSIGLAANRRVHENLRLKTHLAIGCAFYAPSYVALASLGAVSTGLIAPFHLLATAAIIYVLVFAARNIMMAERQSAVSFFDYSGPFFLMWFFPIGVWFVQPRVNRLVSGQ